MTKKRDRLNAQLSGSKRFLCDAKCTNDGELQAKRDLQGIKKQREEELKKVIANLFEMRVLNTEARIARLSAEKVEDKARRDAIQAFKYRDSFNHAMLMATPWERFTF